MDPNEQARHAFGHIGPFIILFWGCIYLVKITLYIIPSWQIAKKAGLSGPLALVAAIPIVGRLVFLYITAFSDWPGVPAAALYTPAPASTAYPPAYPPAPVAAAPVYPPPPPAAPVAPPAPTTFPPEDIS